MDAAAMSADLHILQHSLGLDQYGRGREYRQHFVTGEGSTDYPVCMDLVARGMMVRRDGNELSGGDDIFIVTDAGRAYVASNSPEPPKLSRSAQRYRRYLDADSSLRFGEWLKTSWAKEGKARERAEAEDANGWVVYERFVSLDDTHLWGSL